MNVCYEKTKASVTSPCPLCYCSIKFVRRAKNVKSTNLSQIKAFWDELLAYVRQFQYVLLEITVVQARSWDLVQLLCLFYSPNTQSFNGPLSMSFGIVWPRHCLCLRFFPPYVQLLQKENVIQTFFCSRQLSFRSLCIHVEYIPKDTWSRNDVGSSRSTFFSNFFHMGAIFCFFPAILMSSTENNRLITVVFDERTYIRTFGFLLVFFPSEFQ